MTPRPLALVILDGWGIAPCDQGNAVCAAGTPTLDRLMNEYPTTRLSASGMAVGLPDGQMGNSEVGHLNLGAGRVIYQDLTRVTKAIRDGELQKNPVFLQSIEALKRSGGALHLLGLLSDGGVHSHQDHLHALIAMAAAAGIERIYVHPFLDGRDTPPKSGAGYLARLEEELTALGAGKIATMMGRFYAMDRDNRWDRVERAYRAMVAGEGKQIAGSATAIAEAYEAGETDEFVTPVLLDPAGTIADGDGVWFFNFRADRAREITRALTEEGFSGFDVTGRPTLASYVCLTEYDATFPLPIAFPPDEYRNLLGGILAEAGKKQLRIAETEKYAHVTFFFNGGVEEPFPGEDRALIPSPKEVTTYDQKPSMSAVEVTDEAIRRIESGTYDCIILNYANPDMVGHTGVFSAAVEALETVDRCMARLSEAILAAGGAMLVTADHGNSEKMLDEKGGPHTAHTTNQVPLILVAPGLKGTTLAEGGILADIAPTMLELLGLPVPAEMTGRSLLIHS